MISIKYEDDDSDAVDVSDHERDGHSEDEQGTFAETAILSPNAASHETHLCDLTESQYVHPSDEVL